MYIILHASAKYYKNICDLNYTNAENNQFCNRKSSTYI